MSMLDDFKQSLLPGNYALTKSMELTKKDDSGTLWYTKKYLVLYHFVFLSNDILTNEYIGKVIDIFDTYIASLDESVQEEATRFFYPDEDSRNFKSPNFKSFADFANERNFSNLSELQEYQNRAKNAYFARLTGSGGQSGIKKRIVLANQAVDFCYSSHAMQVIIDDAIAPVCIERQLEHKEINKSDIPRILSSKAIEEIENAAKIQPLTEGIVKEIVEKYPCSNEYPGKYYNATIRAPKYYAVEHDAFASTRNERQILYYYGYFHSKSTGANDFEFSSLTPIGELALKANAQEFWAIWEHQKIKMISQPATNAINKIQIKVDYPERFGISYTPYTDILGHLVRRGSLSLDEYKYIVSRKKHAFDKEEWIAEENAIIAELESIKKHVNAFGRPGDKSNEDGRKELLKYLLGLRSDLSADKKTTPLGVLKFSRSPASVENKDLLTLLYNIYSRLDDYKIQKYETVFADSEADLRKRYVAAAEGRTEKIDGRVKIYWDLYNIHPDTFIMLSVAMTYAAACLGIEHVEDMSKEEIQTVGEYLFNNFRELFRSLGLRSESSIKREVQKAVLALKNEDYSNYLTVEEDHETQILARYKTESTAALMEKIEQISCTATVIPAENRARNSTLVSLLKSYYLQHHGNNHKLQCECCGEETFITNAGEPYVEFHHLIPFNIAYGPDHYLNLFALCPNCHRKIHFLRTDNKKELYDNLSSNNYMHLCFTERLRELRAQNLLRSYHLEYLLADNAINLEEYNTIAA